MLGLAKSWNLVSLLIVLVVMLFFFPVQVGSFQATHGPTTTLKESSAEIMLQSLLALVGAMVMTLLTSLCCFGLVEFSIRLETKVTQVPVFSLRC